ncbi:MlaD family protein [Nocardia callitridis]|uniref:MlaD family protein n=2 Tax=Nocardia callitridis TaxID=648753 RepID=A0ABP9KJU0_9NOCA
MAAALAATLTAGGCGFDPASVPMPGAGVSGDSYTLHIQFANALNLPSRAKVMADGAQVGTVDRVTIVDPAKSRSGTGGYVSVDVDIAKSVELPVGTIAEMRQNTLLGDLHISLNAPHDGDGSVLAEGDTITLEQTRPPVQIEDSLAATATFTQGGAFTRVQEIFDRLNAVLPKDPKETTHIFSVVGADVIDLADNIDRTDQLLNGLGADASVMADNSDTFAELLTDAGVEHTTKAVQSIVDVIGVLGGLGAVAHSLTWLTPIAQSGDAALHAFFPLAFTSRPLDLNAPSNLNALVALVRDQVIPFVEDGSKVNVVKVTEDDPEHPEAGPVSTDDQVQQILGTLRMIGAVR